MNTETRPYTFDRVVRLVIGLGVGGILLWLVYRLRGVLLPFLISWLLAYMMHPMVKFVQTKLKLKNRVLAVTATMLFLLGILIATIAIIVPLVSAEVNKMSVLIGEYTNGTKAVSILPLAWQDDFQAFLSSIDFRALLHSDGFRVLAQKTVPQLWNIVGSSISALAGLTVVFICLLYLVFILNDYDKITNGWLNIIPEKYRPLIAGITQDVEEGMNRYFRGQALIAFLVGILFAIGFSIIGLPLAIVVGLFIGVLNMVPYLQTLGVIPCLLLGLLQSAETGRSFWWILLSIAIVFVVVQCIEEVFLVPKIMGGVTGMSPAMILLSLSVWGSLMGLMGMIIALPMTTLGISYYKRFVLNKEAMPTAFDKQPPANNEPPIP